MPIVTNTIESVVQPNGGSSNVLRLYDQDGREYTYSFITPANFDLQTLINNRIAEMNLHLAESEFEQIIGAG